MKFKIFLGVGLTALAVGSLYNWANDTSYADLAEKASYALTKKKDDTLYSMNESYEDTKYDIKRGLKKAFGASETELALDDIKHGGGKILRGAEHGVEKAVTELNHLSEQSKTSLEKEAVNVFDSFAKALKNSSIGSEVKVHIEDMKNGVKIDVKSLQKEIEKQIEEIAGKDVEVKFTKDPLDADFKIDLNTPEIQKIVKQATVVGVQLSQEISSLFMVAVKQAQDMSEKQEETKSWFPKFKM